MRLLLFCLSLFFMYPAFAVDFPVKPDDRHFYVDEARLLDMADAAELDRIASALLAEKRIPVYVVTIDSLKAYQAGHMTIEDYAALLFDEWGIGFSDWNYGMLLLVSKGDRKARIEFGQSWNHQYDAQAQSIMENRIIPLFKQGDYSAGILAGIYGLNALARGVLPPSPLSELSTSGIILSLIIMAFALALAASLFRNGRSGWGWAMLTGIGLLLVILARGGGSNGGSSGGSGGGFGGGRSGGGGASGSW